MSQQNHSLLIADVHFDEIGKTIRNHVAAHLESIAPLSLPELDDLDNAASNELQSQSAKSSSRQDDQDLPAAIFDDRSIDRPDLLLGDNLTGEPVWTDISDGEDCWDYVFAHSRRRSDYPDLAHDPALKGFVEQARRMEIMRLRQRSKIPIIVVHDPDGLELAPQEWSIQLETSTSEGSAGEFPSGLSLISQKDVLKKVRRTTMLKDSSSYFTSVQASMGEEEDTELALAPAQESKLIPTITLDDYSLPDQELNQ